MIPKADRSQERVDGGAGVGIDAGATLTKLAVRGADGRLEFQLFPAEQLEAAARRVERLGDARVGLTGGGATPLARRLGRAGPPRNEFEAWRLGARALLEREGRPAGQRDLLVSLGTGTSVLLAEPERATRVGGTALGGGTLLGLGFLLTRARSFEELVALASRGDRRSVDLLVSDVYREGPPPLPGDLNASSFAKLGMRPIEATEGLEPCDLAHALMGLVGENVALICAGLAALTGATRLVFGGTTLRGNATLRQVLAGILGALDRDLVFLEEGEFAGALGALLLEDGAAA